MVGGVEVGGVGMGWMGVVGWVGVNGGGDVGVASYGGLPFSGTGCPVLDVGNTYLVWNN